MTDKIKNDMEIDSGKYYKKRQIKVIKEISPLLESIKDDLVLEVGVNEVNRLFKVFYRTWDSMIHEIPYIMVVIVVNLSFLLKIIKVKK